MLKAAGIEAYPVLLSTRDNGKVKTTYPFLHYFNYVIVCAKLDSTVVLLDATEPLCKFNEIPSRCLNDFGFIVQNKSEDEWVQFKSNYVSSIKREFEITPIPEKDSINLNCKLTATGYEALDYRKSYKSGYDKLRERLLSKNSLSDDSIHCFNLNDIDKPFKLNFKDKRTMESVENKLIVSPFCNTAITENPLKMPLRNYPIDMTFKKGNIFKSTIAIPKGYKLFSKPDAMNLNNNMFRISYSADKINNEMLLVIGTYEFKKDVYTVLEYAELKDCFNKIVDKFNEKIVLVKE
jgi:hypothetical protein